MLIRQLNKKLVVLDTTNQEKLTIRRNCVNVATVGNNLYLEDNIFNRVYLGWNPEEFYEKSSGLDIYPINPKARKYQEADIYKMMGMQNILNRNKPGYGKTFEAIEYCRLLSLKKILVVCPKSVIEQWKEQFKQWWPEVEQDVQVGGAGPINRDRTIYINNFEQLAFRSRREGKKKIYIPTQVWQKCKMWSWDIIIVDESHRIKNASAQITMALKELPSQRRMCLTGTPILGHPDDLWSQLQFLDPRWSGASYWAFTERFCECEEDHWGKKPVGLTPSESAQKLLARTLSLISVGGNNEKVTSGKNYIPIKLPMTKEQRNLYKDIVNLSLDNLEKVGITVKNAMDQIVKQQQVTTNCSMFTDSEDVLCPNNPKFEWVRDWLEDNEGEALVVFSKFAETAKALQEYLEKQKIKCDLFIGEMSGKLRQAAKQSFVQHPREMRVLIGTIGAMGTGVDGLQYVSSNVVFLDRDWTPGINEQAEDRVDRSGHEGMTNIWILHMKNSIDEYVEGIQTKKADDIKEIFSRVNDCVRSGE